jgi:hypothetical protein
VSHESGDDWHMSVTLFPISVSNPPINLEMAAMVADVDRLVTLLEGGARRRS